MTCLAAMRACQWLLLNLDIVISRITCCAAYWLFASGVYGFLCTLQRHMHIAGQTIKESEILPLRTTYSLYVSADFFRSNRLMHVDI